MQGHFPDEPFRRAKEQGDNSQTENFGENSGSQMSNALKQLREKLVDYLDILLGLIILNFLDFSVWVNGFGSVVLTEADLKRND